MGRLEGCWRVEVGEGKQAFGEYRVQDMKNSNL